jgi:hypothetical protein
MNICSYVRRLHITDEYTRAWGRGMDLIGGPIYPSVNRQIYGAPGLPQV